MAESVPAGWDPPQPTLSSERQGRNVKRAPNSPEMPHNDLKQPQTSKTVKIAFKCLPYPSECLPNPSGTLSEASRPLVGLGRAEKGALGPFSAFQGPGKTGGALKEFPKGSRRVPKGFPKGWEGIPAGVEGFEGSWGHFGGFPAILGRHCRLFKSCARL